MKDRDFVKKIKTLKKIKPSKSWQKSQKQVLISYIEKNFTYQKDSFLINIFNYIKSFGFINLFVNRVFIFTFLVVLVFASSILGVKAAEKSLPGDLLYNVKITKERLQAQLVSDENERTKLHLKFVKKRLEEIKKLNKSNLDKANKVKRITVAVEFLKNDLEEVKTHIKKESQNKKQSKKFVDLAKNIDKEVSNVAEFLDNNVKALVEKPVQKDSEIKKAQVSVSMAMKVSEEIADSSLDILVQQQNRDKDLDEQIQSKILAKIAKTRNRLQGLFNDNIIVTNFNEKESLGKVKEKVKKDIDTNKNKQDKDVEKNNKQAEVEKQENQKVVGVEEKSEVGFKQEEDGKDVSEDSIFSKIKQVNSLLAKAESSVKSDKLDQALELVKQSQELVRILEQEKSSLVKSENREDKSSEKAQKDNKTENLENIAKQETTNQDKEQSKSEEVKDDVKEVGKEKSEKSILESKEKDNLQKNESVEKDKDKEDVNKDFEENMKININLEKQNDFSNLN